MRMKTCLYNEGVGSLSEYGGSAGVEHSIGWHVVWYPTFRNKVLVGAGERRLGALIHGEAERQGGSVDAIETMPQSIDGQATGPGSARS